MKRKPKIEIVEDIPGTRWYYWRLIGANGGIICHSETFPTRSNALRAAKRAKEIFKEAEIKHE